MSEEAVETPEAPPAAAPPKAPAKPQAPGKAAPFTAMSVPLKSIATNIGQSRGMGVLSTLKQLGYGIFTKLSEQHADKEPIWDMLNSDDADLRGIAIALIDENESGIVKLATGLETNGQLQPIGVNELKPGPNGPRRNVIFGMRRCIATAYLNAKNYGKKGFPREMQAKLFQAASEAEMRFLSREENGNREQESPIDRAMTYKWLTSAPPNGGGLKIEDVCTREDISKVTYHQYVNLLDKVLEKYRTRIHAGEMSVDKATTLRKKLKEDSKATEDTGKSVGGQGVRFPSAKKIKEWYDGALPENMSDELKELYKDDTVRKFLCLNLGFEFKPFVAKAPETVESNGEAAPAKKKKPYEIERAGANALLMACGHTDCETWTDADVVAKIENAPGLGEEGAVLGDEFAQKWFDILYKQFAAGYTIKIKKPKAKAAAK